MQIGEFLNKLKNAKPSGQNQWQADCPCPTHKTPEKHLSITVKDDKILLHCFGSDSPEDIVNILGLEMSDLHLSSPKKKAITSQPIANYDYKDEAGNLIYQVVRFEPKDFRPRHKNASGEWQWNLNGCRRVIYHLDEIVKVGTGTPIYITEGEKDCDNMWMWGYMATTSQGGAEAWLDSYADMLKGHDIVIVPDRDVAGYRYARRVAGSLEGKARSIKVILLPAKDFSEWLEQGGDANEIPSLCQDVSCLIERVDYRRYGGLVIWQSENYQFKAEKIKDERTGIHAKVTIGQKGETLSWSYLNIERGEDRTRLANQAKKGDKELQSELDRFCEGLWDFYLDTNTPELTAGDSEIKPLEFYLKPFIAKETGVIVFAPPGRGKSFTALLWAVSIDAGLCCLWDTQKANVMYINLERSKSSMSRRLGMVNEALGLPSNRPLLMLNARGKSLSDVYPACAKAIRDYNIQMVILDSISRAGMGDLTENNPVNKIMDSLSALCPTWLALAHTPRGDEGHIYGGIHFDAAADVVIQLKSQEKEGKLGLCYQVTKSNDIPKPLPNVIALSFDTVKLITAEKGNLVDFPEILANSKVDMEDAIVEMIGNSDSNDVTATEVETQLGFNRTVVSKLFNSSAKFVRTRKEGRNQYYGVK